MLPFDLLARLLNHKIQTCVCMLHLQTRAICSRADMQRSLLLAHDEAIFEMINSFISGDL